MSSRSRSGRSSRHSSSSSSSSRMMTDEQINDLLSKLQAVLPEAHLRTNHRVSGAKVLQETCKYIRSLHREVEDLSERLSGLLANIDGGGGGGDGDDDDLNTTAQAAIIRSLLNN